MAEKNKKNMMSRIISLFSGKKEDLTEKDHLRMTTLVKISVLEKNIRSKAAQGKFYYVLKDFFKVYFNINYEFTYSELAEEIKHRKIKEDVRIKLVQLCDAMSNAMFDNNELHPTQLRELAEHARTVIKEL